MFIRPINSALSFGNSEKKKTPIQLTVALAATGALAGAGIANATKIKADPSDLDSFISTVDSKLPKSTSTKEEIKGLKTHYSAVKQKAEERLQHLGITPETKELSNEHVLQKIIHPDTKEKNINGLKEEIKYIRGTVDYLYTQPNSSAKINEDLMALREKKLVKDLVENSKDGKIPVQSLRDYYDNLAKDDIFIKHHTDNLVKTIKGFNKTRLGIFTVGGLVVGGIVSQFFKKPEKQALL